MPFHVNVPFCPAEVNQGQLSFLIEHKMLWFYVPVEVPTLMNELQGLENINQNQLVRQICDAWSISLHDDEIVLLKLVVVHPVYTWPFCLGDVLP